MSLLAERDTDQRGLYEALTPETPSQNAPQRKPHPLDSTSHIFSDVPVNSLLLQK